MFQEPHLTGTQTSTVHHIVTNSVVKAHESNSPSFPSDDDFPIDSYNNENVSPGENHTNSPTLEIQRTVTTQLEPLYITTASSVNTIPPQQVVTTESHSEDHADDNLLSAYEGTMTTLNDGLALSLFSREEQVQIDLLQTLNNLGTLMKAYEEVMR